MHVHRLDYQEVSFSLLPRRSVHLVGDGIDRPPDLLQAPGPQPRQLVHHDVLGAEALHQR